MRAFEVFLAEVSEKVGQGRGLQDQIKLGNGALIIVYSCLPAVQSLMVFGERGIYVNSKERVANNAFFDGPDAGSEGVAGEQIFSLLFIKAGEHKTTAFYKFAIATYFVLLQGLLQFGFAVGGLTGFQGDAPKQGQAHEPLFGVEGSGRNQIKQ